MAFMSFNSEYVAVSCGTRVLVSQNEKENLVAVDPEVISNLVVCDTECEPAVESPQWTISAFDLSSCCRWIALCSSNKSLSIWSCSNWKLKSKKNLQRSAEKVKFTPSGNDVIVADKSGDAFIFSVQNTSSEAKLLFGHLSMLLDILVSDDEKFIISCDRDEKIRVSHFPNAYNIQSYCLGHKEFVSSLHLLPHDKTVLLSGSGDGTLRCWNYINGDQIQMIDCFEVIKSNCHLDIIKTAGSNLNETNNDGEKCIYNCAIMRISCSNFNRSSLTGVCIQGFKGILIFRLHGNFEAIEYSLTEVLYLTEEPWDICFSFNGFLWYLHNGEKPLGCSCLDDKGKVLRDQIARFGSFNIFNNYWKWLKNLHVPERRYTLYKRKYDNVFYYAEKKKARLTRDNNRSN